MGKHKTLAKIILFSIVLLLLFSQVKNVKACGCGIALTDEGTFNSLKETQAYLLIDAKDKQTYDENIFFRVVSTDKPQNLTIVFPMDKIPADVNGSKISASGFLDDYKISDLEAAEEEQDAEKLKENVEVPLFFSANGIASTFVYKFMQRGAVDYYEKTFAGAGAPQAEAKALAPVAHFEFEGGSLDVYNITSAQTLDEFVKTIDVSITGKVKDLVEKYKNYYVAVLYLQVPAERNDQSFPIDDEGGIPSYYRSGGEQNGTLVTMNFENTAEFFYPTSIVSSYNEAIDDERYFVKVPRDLKAKLTSAKVEKTINLENERWYKISPGGADIKGKLSEADFNAKFGDFKRESTAWLNANSSTVIMLFYLLFLIVPPFALKKKENLTWGEVGWAVGMYFLGGFLLSALIMGVVKKKKVLALTYIGLWIILLAILFL